MKWLSQEVRIDLLLLAALLCFALIYLHGSPEQAANLPWDGDSYAVPIVNFLDGYGFGCEIHGQLCQSAHPPGMALMLLPSYLLFGHFIGNGFYSIQFAALATIILLYFIGKTFGGRLLGAFAGLFFISLQDVRIYSTVIMSEMPTCFLLIAMFAVLLFLRKGEYPLVYIFLGTLLGLAIAVRIDSVLLVLPTALVLFYGGITPSAKRIGLVLFGVAPWLLMLAAYNQHYFGSWKRSSLQYWQGDHLALFSTTNLTARGSWKINLRKAPSQANANKMDGNLVGYAKTILSEADGTLPFGPTTTTTSNHIYQAAVVLRALLACLAVVICFRRFRTDSNLRSLLIWFGTGLVSLYVFFVFFNQQCGRYFLRFAPFFALLDAMGLVWLIRRAKEEHQRVLLTFMGVGLVAVLAVYGASDKVYHGDSIPPAYLELKTADSMMESNAVVVSNFVGFRTPFFLIRGTQRIQMPLGVRDALPIWPDPKSPDASPPPVCKDPSKVLELASEGRPIYVVLDRFWGSTVTQDDEDNFWKYFDTMPLVSVTRPKGAWPYFFRATPKLPPVARPSP
jgi:4-amino-4-deoxy-L-arabinose transferase-like glycosyltransferase